MAIAANSSAGDAGGNGCDREASTENLGYLPFADEVGEIGKANEVNGADAAENF